jgi:hypothetical protein
VIAANVLLGLNQGLCWSTTVIMKIDLAGPARRGLAMGLKIGYSTQKLSGRSVVTNATSWRSGSSKEDHRIV